LKVIQKWPSGQINPKPLGENGGRTTKRQPRDAAGASKLGRFFRAWWAGYCFWAVVENAPGAGLPINELP
jgi:hypothetical protein